FEEFASALPAESAAPLLGQELGQIEWLVNGVLDAHVESLTAFRRAPLNVDGTRGALPTATPPGPAKTAAGATVSANLLERNVVELTFVSTPSVARKVINQIAGANQHFCIIR